MIELTCLFSGHYGTMMREMMRPTRGVRDDSETRGPRKNNLRSTACVVAGTAPPPPPHPRRCRRWRRRRDRSDPLRWTSPLAPARGRRDVCAVRMGRPSRLAAPASVRACALGGLCAVPTRHLFAPPPCATVRRWRRRRHHAAQHAQRTLRQHGQKVRERVPSRGKHAVHAGHVGARPGGRILPASGVVFAAGSAV